MSEWKEVQIGDVCKVGDGAHIKVNRQEKGVLYLTSKNFASGCLKLDNIDFISEEDYERLFPEKSKAVTRLQPNDVLMGIIGTFGNAYKYKEIDFFGVSSSVAIIRPQVSKLDSDFLVYLLNSENFKFIHQAYSSGSVQGYSNIPTIKSMPIAIPCVQTQEKIVSALKPLDRKIENLRKQNETLERIAQTLFKQWFVDFEFPNNDGKPYKSSGGEMVQSELGEIPVGWRVGTLGDLFTLNYGKSLTLETRIPGRYPVVGSSGIVGNHQSYLVKAPGIVIGRKGTIGRVIWLEENFCPIDTTFYVDDILGCNSLYFYYFLLKRQNFQRLTSDSAVPGLNRDMAYSVEIIVPEISHINRFNTVIEAVFNKINLNQRQIQTLTKTRDALLPKLMSGQLRITQ
jgi:type I restriction enzyme, S subunit